MCAQGRFLDRLSMLLTAPKVNQGIQSRWLSYLQQVDGSLAAKVGAVLGHVCWVQGSECGLPRTSRAHACLHACAWTRRPWHSLAVI